VISGQELLAGDEVSIETDSTAEQLVDPVTPAGRRSLRRRDGWTAAVLVVMIVAASCAGAWQYVDQYRFDAATNAHAADDAVTAARDGAVAILSYSPDTLERDFASAKSHLTGEFLSYYREFTEQVVRPAATEQKVKTTAEVTRAALSEIAPNSAKVLVFINQTTASTAKPDPVLTASSVLVTVERHGNAWLISGFDPL
jgi:Mce-associated membrane protein